MNGVDEFEGAFEPRPPAEFVPVGVPVFVPDRGQMYVDGGSDDHLEGWTSVEPAADDPYRVTKEAYAALRSLPEGAEDLGPLPALTTEYSGGGRTMLEIARRNVAEALGQDPHAAPHQEKLGEER
jgi:hypothetical protein